MIPFTWKVGAAVLGVTALLAGGQACIVRIEHVAYKAGYDRADGEWKVREGAAILVRARADAQEAMHQADINSTITKAKNEEITPVVQRIYVDRVRVGAGTCVPATTSKTDDARRSDDADSSGRLVREDVERDTRALTEAVELDMATGRACQAWGKENGFMP